MNAEVAVTGNEFRVRIDRHGGPASQREIPAIDGVRSQAFLRFVGVGEVAQPSFLSRRRVVPGTCRNCRLLELTTGGPLVTAACSSGRLRKGSWNTGGVTRDGQIDIMKATPRKPQRNTSAIAHRV